MNVPWSTALAVFLGTLPVFGVIVWNLIEVQSLRSDMTTMRNEMSSLRKDIAQEFKEIRQDLSKINERLAVLETKAGIPQPSPLVNVPQ